MLMLLGTMVWGFGLRSTDIRDPRNESAQKSVRVHRLSGVFTGVVVVLVNCITMTYFIGTGRWCKEVVEAYSLSADFVTRSTRYKRRAFPASLASMLGIVSLVALGGAADPGAYVPPLKLAGLTWSQVHFGAALLGFAGLGWLLMSQAAYIRANHELVAEILGEVQRVRQERGLRATES